MRYFSVCKSVAYGPFFVEIQQKSSEVVRPLMPVDPVKKVKSMPLPCITDLSVSIPSASLASRCLYQALCTSGWRE